MLNLIFKFMTENPKHKKLTLTAISTVIISLISFTALIFFIFNYQSQKSKSEMTGSVQTQKTISNTTVESTNNVKKQDSISTKTTENKAALQSKEKEVAINNVATDITPKNSDPYKIETYDSANSICDIVIGGVSYLKKDRSSSNFDNIIFVTKSNMYETSEQKSLLSDTDKFIKSNSQDIESVNQAFQFSCSGYAELIYKELDIKVKGADYSRVLITKSGQEYLSPTYKIVGVKNDNYFNISGALQGSDKSYNELTEMCIKAYDAKEYNDIQDCFDSFNFTQTNLNTMTKSIQNIVNTFEIDFNY